ncbi:MAG: insulinase family protein [Alphaproteobacteria bacterium]|nr:MAG: insulinase family protein [Alphaproteobacteria bacterium]
MWNWLFGAVLALGLSLANAAQAVGNVTDFTLPNGLRIVVIEDHRAPVVTHMIWYRVGSADERLGKSGIAHFLEHLMFKGTTRYPAGEFSRIVEANGGSDNAFTSADYTAYYQRVAADRLSLMMDMEADRMRYLSLTEDDVATERNVILEERATRVDNKPAALLREEMMAALYRNSHYGIPTIGWRHEIEQLNRKDALDFYRTYYAPNNAILIVAGDVDPADVLALAQLHYGPLPPSDDLPERVRPQEPPAHAALRLSLRDARVSQPVLQRRYLAPVREPGDQRRAAALVYLAELLGGDGATSVLGQALQFDRQIAVHTGAGYDPTALDTGSFSLVVVPAEGVSLAEAEAALDETLAHFLETGPDPEAFARLKAQIRASEIYALDDVGGIAERYGRALTTGLSIEDVKAWPQVLQDVTIEDVALAARELLDLRASVTGWLEPEEARQ